MTSPREIERPAEHKPAERSRFQLDIIGVSADARFSAFVGYWFEDMEIKDASRELHHFRGRNMLRLVVPVLAEFTPPGTGVARCDYFLKQFAKQSYNLGSASSSRLQARTRPRHAARSDPE